MNASAPPAPAFIGANVYLWEALEQNKFLVHVLGPLVESLVEDGLADLFVCDRFDARGPHVFFALRSPDSKETERRIHEAVRPFLQQGEASTRVTDAEIAELHEQCRGKAMWSVDREPGLAKDRTLVVAAQKEHGYPFSHWRDFKSTERERLSALMTDSTRWALSVLPAERPSHVGAAVTWCAHFDFLLREHIGAAAAADYWRHHAMTLMMGLAERWQEEPDAVLASLPGRVPPKNAAIFEKIFSSAESQPAEAPWQGWPELVALGLSGAPDREASHRAFREMLHVTWKQLGLLVSLHIPIVLFAWQRNIELGDGA